MLKDFRVARSSGPAYAMAVTALFFFFFRLMCPQFNVLARRQSRLDRIVMIVIIILRLQHSAMCAHIDTFFFFGIYKCLEWNCNNNNDDGRCSGVVL